MQDALHEITDQLGAHRQVQGHSFGGQRVDLDAQRLVERDAREELADGLVQFRGEFAGWIGHGRLRQ
ncbi:hypothetical protein D3C77_661300 [compost metagenome]